MSDAANVSAARGRLAFALDYPTLDAARAGAEQVSESVGVLKVGLELFVRAGPSAVAIGRDLGCDVFLDLKLHDIPETVDRAVGSAIDLGVRYLTLHAGGGRRMLEQAAKRVQTEGVDLTLLAVTVLTSLDDEDLASVGVRSSSAEQALRLGKLAVDAGVGGLVCSTREVGAIRDALGPETTLVTPGIRPAFAAAANDQKRTGSPASAIAAGASLLVVGRPIRDAEDPPIAARTVALEIASAIA